jgi:hypothetical protein
LQCSWAKYKANDSEDRIRKQIAVNAADEAKAETLSSRDWQKSLTAGHFHLPIPLTRFSKIELQEKDPSEFNWGLAESVHEVRT